MGEGSEMGERGTGVWERSVCVRPLAVATKPCLYTQLKVSAQHITRVAVQYL